MATSTRRLWLIVATLAVLVGATAAAWLALRSPAEAPAPPPATGAGPASRPAPAAGGAAQASGDKARSLAQHLAVALAALQVDAHDRARQHLEQSLELAPDEPALWANLGLLEMQLGRFADAEQALEKAQQLSPDHPGVLALLGALRSRQGRAEEAMEIFRRVLEQDPEGGAPLPLRFQLAREAEKSGERGLPEAAELLAGVVEQDPDNLHALLEWLRVAAKADRDADVKTAVARLQALSSGWDRRAKERLSALSEEVQAGGDVGLGVAFLRGALRRSEGYQESQARVEASGGDVTEPVRELIAYPTPPPDASAPADAALRFARSSLVEGEASSSGEALFAVPLVDDTLIVTVAGRESTVLFGPDAAGLEKALSRAGRLYDVVGLDADDDFVIDVVAAGSRGVFLCEKTPRGWCQKTERLLRIRKRARPALLPLDWENDGDVDLLVVGAGRSPRLLKNKGGGSFARPQKVLPGKRLAEAAWADLDRDGTGDLVALTEAREGPGSLAVWLDERGGRYRPAPAPDLKAAAFAVADIDRDGRPEVITWTPSGALVQADFAPGSPPSWSTTDLHAGPAPAGEARLLVEDVDNNAALDLILADQSGTRVLLQGAGGDLSALDADLGARVTAALDLDDDGEVDLLGLDAGEPVRLTAEPTKGYGFLTLKPKAASRRGDARISARALGAEVRLIAGLSRQQRRARGPRVRFGLGDKEGAELARVRWPNGTSQYEFDLESGKSLEAVQRLKGSCPFLFARVAGEERPLEDQFAFVTDFLWRSPLGLAINAVETAGVAMTSDRVRIAPGVLHPRQSEGEARYDLRITAELWETHFFDQVRLLAVDHPSDVHVWIDERFAFPPPSLEPHATAAPRPVAAIDSRGRDVSGLLAEVDDRSVGGFALGRYQGVAAPHFVEVEVPADHERLVLLARGYTYPTDSSLNVAMSQGEHPRPSGIRLLVDKGGGWQPVSPDLGFPSGKDKTVVLDLERFLPDGTTRVRLQTNLEVYWDWVATARRSDVELAVREVPLREAELSYRGFSRMVDPRREVPERPVYDVERTAPPWLDLEGFYTRFGPVDELLAVVDDRYTILNAGDELQLVFGGLEDPPGGAIRTFLLEGDGWIKDGDFNTALSRTVRPLPAHDVAYPSKRVPLEDDPVYRAHPEDWRRFHTRYVTAAPHEQELISP